MINSDIRTEEAPEGKANYVIILHHFELLITTCYHCHFLGSNPVGTTSKKKSRLFAALFIFCL